MKKTMTILALFAAFSLAGWAQDGGALYGQKCAMCHGPAGQGKPNGAPKLVGTAKTVDQIVDLLTKGGASKGIHVKPMTGLTAEQARAAATHVKSLK